MDPQELLVRWCLKASQLLSVKGLLNLFLISQSPLIAEKTAAGASGRHIFAPFHDLLAAEVLLGNKLSAPGDKLSKIYCDCARFLGFVNPNTVHFFHSGHHEDFYQ